MKKLLYLALVLALPFVLAACAGQDGTTGKPTPSTTAGQPEPTTTVGQPDPTTTGTRPHEHVFGDWTVTTAATCTADGLKERTCTCGEKETEVIAATGHVFGDWTVTTEATCTADGLKERTCACGEKESEVIAATGHGATEVRDAKAATCTTDGYTGDTYCTVCNEKIASGESIPTTGHDYQDGVCAACGAKEPIPSTGLKYELNPDGESYCVIDIGTCTDTDIVIPSTYEGKPVTAIGEGAFGYCEKLTSVVIPTGVVSIGDSAFRYCESMTSITIPDSVTSIGAQAFCMCASLTSVTIPHGVTSIGEWTFAGCPLTSIEIPNSVTSIDYAAFYLCYNLTSVTIANSVTSIAFGVFADCRSLTNLVIAEDNPVYHSAGNCEIETATKTLVAACPNSVIPDDGSVTAIGEYAFSGGYGWSLLTNIAIPNGITSIGEGAFWNCRNLTSIAIPAGVTNIDNSAFEGCSSLTDITFAGTKAQWDVITKGNLWDNYIESYTIHCTDGDISK